MSEGWFGLSNDEFDRLVEELRPLARALMARQSAGHTLQATALINASFEKLLESSLAARRLTPEHVKAVTARVMRQVLIDHAREKGQGRKLPRERRVSFTIALGISGQGADPIDSVTIGEILDRMSVECPEQLEVFDLRVFSGMEIQEIAELKQMHRTTIQKYWNFAKGRFAQLWRQGEQDGEL